MLLSRDPSVGPQAICLSYRPFGVLSPGWREAGVVLPHGEQDDAGRRASGLERGSSWWTG